MTTPTPESVEALADLADRVEAAQGPDRELDAEVMALLFQREDRHIGTTEEGPDGKWAPVADAVWVNPHTGKWVSTHPHRFTASLDAAMTLVPENPYNTGERFQVESWTTNGVHAEHVRASAWVSGTRRVFAATPALALTAAALRARADHLGASHG